MVSQLSARLLAGTREDSPLSARLLQGRRGDASIQSSSRGSQSSQKKRTASGLVKTGPSTNGTEKTESSVSGYSGDKEDQSVLPPVLVSIDLHGRENKNSSPSCGRGTLDCPKRRKIQETQFAATTAKDDLQRAGMEFKKVNRDLEEVACPGEIRIKLKGVRLIHSNEALAPLVTSNVSQNCTVADYEALVDATREFYAVTSLACIKPFEQSQGDREGSSSSDRSTSSVSDTESDSGSDNVNNGKNNHILLIPPRVEDSMGAKQKRSSGVLLESSPCNVISCASNATTMTESLQLTKDPRCAVKLLSSSFFYLLLIIPLISFHNSRLLFNFPAIKNCHAPHRTLLYCACKRSFFAALWQAGDRYYFGGVVRVLVGSQFQRFGIFS
jgi:hypothetical protein